MATESLAPVAAITDLILGTLTIILANRAANHDPHKRFTALLFGWTFIFIGTYYMIVSLIELRHPDGVFGWSLIQFGTFAPTGDGMYDALVFMMYGLQAGINILTLALALHLPFDLGSGRGWNSAVIGIPAEPLFRSRCRRAHCRNLWWILHRRCSKHHDFRHLGRMDHDLHQRHRRRGGPRG